MPQEIWKTIPSLKGYAASNLGRIKSLQRTLQCTDGRVQRHKGYVRKQQTLRTGHLQVTIPILGKRKSYRVHVLVAETFIGRRPVGMDVCHNDGNPKNNHLHNLRYDTRLGNCADTVRQGRSNRGEKNGGVKLTGQEVNEVRRLIKQGFSQADVALMKGVHQSTISRIVTNTRWKHLTKKEV